MADRVDPTTDCNGVDARSPLNQNDRQHHVSQRTRTYADRSIVDETSCPKCRSETITPGQLVGGGPVGFFPAGLRFWSLKTGGLALPVAGIEGSHAQACTACGLVWSQIDAPRLLEMLREAGTDETRARLERSSPDGGASRPAV